MMAWPDAVREIRELGLYIHWARWSAKVHDGNGRVVAQLAWPVNNGVPMDCDVRVLDMIWTELLFLANVYLAFADGRGVVVVAEAVT